MSETAPSGGQTAASGGDLKRMIADLLAEGERLQAKAQQTPPDLLALMGLTSTSTVTITTDHLGLMNSISIIHPDDTRPEPAELLMQLNLALYRGEGPAMLRAIPATAAGQAFVSEDGDIAPELRDFMQNVSTGSVPEPTLVTNDLKTVTIGALFGDVVSIDCSPPFLAAASDETLTDEIVRVARIAAVTTDVLGRHTERSI